MLTAARTGLWRGARGIGSSLQAQSEAVWITTSWRGACMRAGFKHRPKQVTPESYIKFTEIVDGQVVEKKNVTVEDVFSVLQPQKDSKKLERGLKASGSTVPVPCSPVLGPVTVNDPEAFSKKYKWCSCGMSSKQPFCDMSHKGTEFRPLRFFLQDAKQDIQLCGCKLSTKAPFCDGLTCHQVKEGQSNPLKLNSSLIWPNQSPAEILETRAQIKKSFSSKTVQSDQNQQGTQ